MKFERFIVGMGEANGYILFDEESLEAIIIDPGDEESVFINYIQKHHLNPKEIVLTHYHYDHIGVVEGLKNKYKCPVSIHKKDVEGLKDPSINHSARGYRRALSIAPDRILSDGDIIEAGKIVLEVIHTPGHTPGSICLMVPGENMAFTGDTIFDDDLGRTDLEGGSADAMKRSIVNKISKWDDAVRIYPGHAESATMAFVRQKNTEYLDMIK